MSRLDHLREEYDKDLQLLKNLNNKRRGEDNPRLIHKWEDEIQQTKQKLNEIEQEIKEIENNQPEYINVPKPKKRNFFTKLAAIDKKILLCAILILILTVLIISLSTIKQQNKQPVEPLNNIVFCQNNKNKSENIKSLSTPEYFSCGDKKLILGHILDDKDNGIKAYHDGDLSAAITYFQQSRDSRKTPSDPEALIYLNNAKVGIANIEFYIFAVVVPINNLEVASDILRGVAQAQQEWINNEQKIYNIGIKILIVNDENNEDRAKTIAEILTKEPRVIAVIGHYSSDATLKASNIYEGKKLVYISSGSTSTELRRSNNNYNFFFRTVPPLFKYTAALVEYLKENSYTKLVVFYNRTSRYSEDFWKKLKDDLPDTINILNNKYDKDFILSDPFFQPDRAIKRGGNKNQTAFVLIPDGGTSEYSLLNAIKLIKANRGEYFMLGANTLSSIDTLLVGKDAMNHLVISMPQIETIVSQSDVVKEAKELWQIQEISERTVVAYDAAKALSKVLPESMFKKNYPIRQSIQETLSNIEFIGADNQKFKFIDGERENISGKNKVELAKIVESKCSTYGYIFVPKKYTNEQIRNLENNCQQ